jgi:4-hydroxythreonine-4-phosphate dehydrogenase
MLPLALTMGEPAGVGAEIAQKAWKALSAEAGARPFLLIDDATRITAVPVVRIEAPEQAAAAFRSALPVLHRPLPRPATPGRPDPITAPAVIAAIEEAVALAKAGRVAGVVTNPIQKASLTTAGFPYPGHTEFLAELSGTGRRPVMMLASPLLRVVPVTIHLSLARAIAALTTGLIVETAETAAEALTKDFGIAVPRLALSGLNPHAGEDGTMGMEDRDIIAPAVAELNRRGITARGPLPADTMFTPRARATYDLALGMTHDQALIPIKTLDMDGGVNVTLGLSIIRTSPDHGTALDIAGRGLADPGSLIAALRLASEMAAARGLTP